MTISSCFPYNRQDLARRLEFQTTISGHERGVNFLRPFCCNLPNNRHLFKLGEGQSVAGNGSPLRDERRANGEIWPTLTKITRLVPRIGCLQIRDQFFLTRLIRSSLYSRPSSSTISNFLFPSKANFTVPFTVTAGTFDHRQRGVIVAV